MSPIRWFNKLESTNDEARRRFSGLDNLSVVACRNQTAGRGQGDHTWYSPAGRNLTFSIVFKYEGMPLDAPDAALVSSFVTLGILDYLRDKGVEGRIKWPNDIWIADRKICGILVENTIENNFVTGSIIGVGFNLNERIWPPELPNPVSLLELTGKRRCPALELRRLVKKICRRSRLLSDADGRKVLQEEFGKYVFRIS